MEDSVAGLAEAAALALVPDEHAAVEAGEGLAVPRHPLTLRQA